MSPRSAGTSPSGLTTVATQILLSLTAENRHGYGIKLDIEERTAGAIDLGSGTLYQALQRLETRGLIATAERTATDARRGREYRLTTRGREALDEELELMRRTLSYAEAQPAPSRSS